MGLGCRKSFLNKHQRPMNTIWRALEMQPGKALQDELIAELKFESGALTLAWRPTMRPLDWVRIAEFARRT